MAKVKLNFLLEKRAILCGDLLSFNEGYERYSEQEVDTMGRKGVYVILSENQEFIYPKGESRVIYIGKADNLHRRIKEHKKRLSSIESLSSQKMKEFWDNNRYLYMKEFGAKVYYIPALKNKDPRNLERDIIEEFYNKYMAIPVGNGALSYGKS